MATMKTCPVSFNIDREDHREVYEWSRQLDNFSAVARDLLAKEMKRRKAAPTVGRGIRFNATDTQPQRRPSQT